MRRNNRGLGTKFGMYLGELCLLGPDVGFISGNPQTNVMYIESATVPIIRYQAVLNNLYMNLDTLLD